MMSRTPGAGPAKGWAVLEALVTLPLPSQGSHPPATATTKQEMPCRGVRRVILSGNLGSSGSCGLTPSISSSSLLSRL